MNLHKISFLILLSLCGYVGYAQSGNAGIKGKVNNATSGNPLDFATILLIHSEDSMKYTGVITDSNGIYHFKNVPPGIYYLKVSFIGYEVLMTPSFSIAEEQQLEMNTLLVKETARILQEIEISEEKLNLETSINELVYNVDKDVSNSFGSAADVLDKIPSVSVDADGTLLFKGSSNLNILINDKPSPLMRLNSEEALALIPANTIERIEVITNPSADNKPDGASINIILKKEAKSGFNGILIANTGNNDRYNTTLSFNYKPGKFNYFGNYSLNRDYDKFTATDVFTERDSLEKLISHNEETGLTTGRPLAQTGQIGIDYVQNKNNTLSISGNYFNSDFTQSENNHIQVTDSLSEIISDYAAERQNKIVEFNKELSAHYVHNFNRENHELDFEFTITDHRLKNDNTFVREFNTPAFPRMTNILNYQVREKSQIAAFKYSFPLNDHINMEAGYQPELIHQDYNFNAQYFDPSTQQWKPDPLKIDHFVFNEDIHALFCTYAQSMKRFEFLLGLRGEEVLHSIHTFSSDTLVQNNYFKLFPSIHFSYKTRKGREYKLSYSKQVHRPEGDELNPFPDYSDPNDLSAGNPLLKPELIHSIEFGYEIKNDQSILVPGIFYKYTYNGFSEITRPLNDSVLITTFLNLLSEQSAGIGIIFSWLPGKKIKLNVSSDIYYNMIDGSDIGFSEKKSTIAGNMRIISNIHLTKTTILQLNANYKSAQLTSQGRFLPGYVLNAGLKQMLFKQRAFLSVTLSDVFNSVRWTSEINDEPEFIRVTKNKHASRVGHIGFTYYFGERTNRNSEVTKIED